MSVFASNVARAEARRSPEDAYWELLRDCVADPLGSQARRCVAEVIQSHDPAWAYEVLYASYLLAAKDIDRPEAPMVALVTDDEQRKLVDIIVYRGSAEQKYRTMGTVFISGEQKIDMLRALRRSKSRTWIREAIRDLRLTPEQCAILTGK